MLPTSLKPLALKVRRHFRRFGLRDGVRLIPLKLARRVAGSAGRRWDHPYLHDFHALPQNIYSAAEKILVRCTGATPSAIAGLRDEFELLRARLEERRATRRLAYPEHFTIGTEASFLIYGLVRLRRFESILETGVANGHSTYYLLHALRANGRGRLCSVDIGTDVGVLVDPAERAAWTYLGLAAGREREDFQACLDRLRPIDLFLHDSDHTYRWQMFEYRSAWASLGSGGLFLSDNVDHSFAFVDFCAERKIEPVVLISGMRVFGLVEAS
jgi:predicted O-methyltransferase YrrM